MITKAYLFGPFFGELSWEFFRFAPYAIYLKKSEPEKKLVVFTRPSRFDLYGQYADILVPLCIKDDQKYTEKAFRLVGFDSNLCKMLVNTYRFKYRKKFNIVDHFYPDGSTMRHNLKWQFPRGKMDYDFKPRILNHNEVDKFFKNRRLET